MLLNAKTGELIIDDEVLNDSQVLQVLSDEFSLVEGTEHAFTLHTFRRMFQLYPALTYVNAYAESFLEQAKLVKPKFHVVRPDLFDGACSVEPNYESLELSKLVTIRISELTRVSSELVPVKAPVGVVSINGVQNQSYSIKLEFEDKPSFDTQEDVDLSGIAEGVSFGLDMERLPRLMHLKISMPGSHYQYVQEYALPDRTGPDRDRTVETSVIHAHHGISLLEAIDAVLYGINLDDEADYLEEKAMLEDMLSDLDLGGLPILELPIDEDTDKDA